MPWLADWHHMQRVRTTAQPFINQASPRGRPAGLQSRSPANKPKSQATTKPKSRSRVSRSAAARTHLVIWCPFGRRRGRKRDGDPRKAEAQSQDQRPHLRSRSRAQKSSANRSGRRRGAGPRGNYPRCRSS